VFSARGTFCRIQDAFWVDLAFELVERSFAAGSGSR
jgi:hypothetical protein